jgi:xylitol oxidase
VNDRTAPLELKNWAGNYTYAARKLITPQSLEELQAAIAGSQVIRALGSRHSFNDLADTEDTLISLRHFDRIFEPDLQAQTVTVEAGVTYGQLCAYLDQRGLAVHNLASLPHISVVGACMTGTHGSGERNGNLATIVRAIEFVAADGTLVQVSRDAQPDEFRGLVVGLGAYGVVTKMTLDIQPRFTVAQQVFLDLPFERAIADFDAIQSGGYSVSLFTKWQDDRFEQVWVKQIVDADRPVVIAPDYYGALASANPIHPVSDMDPVACTGQLGEAGAWHQRLPHFRMEFTPSHGDELQTEYFVPRARAAEALEAVRRLSAIIAPLLYISEIRTVAADDLWLSPSYQRETVAIHFTWQPRWTEVSDVLPRIEQALMPFDVRPHWGKLFRLSGAHIQAQYTKLPEFRELAQRYDPTGKFRNRLLNTCIFA